MNKLFEIKHKITISTGEVLRTKDDIILYDPLPYLDSHTIEQIEEMDIAVREITKGERLPYIVDVNRVTKFGAKEKNLAREKLKIFHSAAFVTKSSISKVLLSVFLLFHRKEPIIKLFSSMEEAKKWSLENHPLKNK